MICEIFVFEVSSSWFIVCLLVSVIFGVGVGSMVELLFEISVSMWLLGLVVCRCVLIWVVVWVLFLLGLGWFVCRIVVFVKGVLLLVMISVFVFGKVLSVVLVMVWVVLFSVMIC